MKNALLIAVGVLVFVLFIGFVWGISYSNKEVVLRNQCDAQKQVLEANFDKMWKIISQLAQVPEQYKADFKDVYGTIMQGRYSGEKGQLMLWIQENNPTFDSSLYHKLMTAIEANRTEFFYEQKKMISMVNQHKNLIQMIPGKWFLSGKLPIEFTVISSEKSKAVMESGKEDNVDVFQKK